MPEPIKAKPFYNNHSGVYLRDIDPRFDLLLATATGHLAATLVVDALNAKTALLPKVEQLLKYTANNGDPWAEKAAVELLAALKEQGWTS